jgi:hypothetical protein
MEPQLSHKDGELSLSGRAGAGLRSTAPRLEYLCNGLREAQPRLPTHSFLMRWRALNFSSRILNDQRRACREDT